MKCRRITGGAGRRISRLRFTSDQSPLWPTAMISTQTPTMTGRCNRCIRRQMSVRLSTRQLGNCLDTDMSLTVGKASLFGHSQHHIGLADTHSMELRR
jgi:hypothetical protein